ncbi:hypothetical protein WME94_12575 [Sorangium sp. So ce429]
MFPRTLADQLAEAGKVAADGLVEVVDQAGHVVGVMTVSFQPRMQGKLHLEAGGEDATAIYRSVEQQR